jgi:hypothetical protein
MQCLNRIRGRNFDFELTSLGDGTAFNETSIIFLDLIWLCYFSHHRVASAKHAIRLNSRRFSPYLLHNFISVASIRTNEFPLSSSETHLRTKQN